MTTFYGPLFTFSIEEHRMLSGSQQGPRPVVYQDTQTGQPITREEYLAQQREVSFTGAARVSGSMRRHFNQSNAAAEVARQEAQRCQAAEKGQHMKPPNIFPLTPSTTAPASTVTRSAGGLDPAERRELLSHTDLGRQILREEDAAKPAQFTEKPLDAEMRTMLSHTHMGQQILRERDERAGKPAMFAETSEEDTEMRRLLSYTHLGRQILKERGITP